MCFVLYLSGSGGERALKANLSIHIDSTLENVMGQGGKLASHLTSSITPAISTRLLYGSSDRGEHSDGRRHDVSLATLGAS